jgi:hypothetical protein
MAAERKLGPRRVLAEDLRRNGRHLQVTWHPDSSQFVVSTWEDGVCLAAVRIDPTDAAGLAGVLSTGTDTEADGAGGSLTG